MLCGKSLSGEGASSFGPLCNQNYIQPRLHSVPRGWATMFLNIKPIIDLTTLSIFSGLIKRPPTVKLVRPGHGCARQLPSRFSDLPITSHVAVQRVKRQTGPYGKQDSVDWTNTNELYISEKTQKEPTWMSRRVTRPPEKAKYCMTATTPLQKTQSWDRRLSGAERKKG